MVLSRLGGRDGAAMVERLAGGSGLSSEMIAEIVERSDGVPLFVEELTKAVLESTEPGGQVAAVLSATPQSALLVPATLHASLMARLDRLGRLAKEIAQAGAVLGREFPYDFSCRSRGGPRWNCAPRLTGSREQVWCSAAALCQTHPICSNTRWCRMRLTARCYAGGARTCTGASPRIRRALPRTRPSAARIAGPPSDGCRRNRAGHCTMAQGRPKRRGAFGPSGGGQSYQMCARSAGSAASQRAA